MPDPSGPPTPGNPSRPRILVVGVDPLIVPMLSPKPPEAEREIRAVSSMAEAQEALAQETPSLVLLDLMLPDGDGRRLLSRLRENPETDSVPIIILSGVENARMRAECFALGADQFLEKPVDPAVLAVEVTSRLRRSEENRRRSRQDPLTGLPNRAAFHEAYRSALSLAARARLPLSLSLLDIDHFKSVNDTHGHNVGDDVLRRLTSTIRASLRDSDLMARWGGEEFSILFPNTALDGAIAALEKSLDAVRVEEFRGSSGMPFHVTFSAGVAEVASGATLEEGMAEADRHLYVAKAAGRNRVASARSAPAADRPRILIVDDDPPIVALVRHRLSREGFNVISAGDGPGGLDAARESRPDLIVLDVMMPGMDGFTVLKQLRAEPAYARTPVMMLTGLGEDASLVRAFDLGADDYMVKPFSPEELTARVRRLLRRR